MVYIDCSNGKCGSLEHQKKVIAIIFGTLGGVFIIGCVCYWLLMNGRPKWLKTCCGMRKKPNQEPEAASANVELNTLANNPYGFGIRRRTFSFPALPPPTHNR